MHRRRLFSSQRGGIVLDDLNGGKKFSCSFSFAECVHRRTRQPRWLEGLGTEAFKSEYTMIMEIWFKLRVKKQN